VENVLRRRRSLESWQQSVASAQRGDLMAFGAVVEHFQDMAVGYAYSILRDFHLSEDAAQEAFVRAYLDLRTLREPRAFPSWLRRIIFKQCDRITRRKRVRTVPLDAGVESADPRKGPLEVVEQRETQEEVLSAVNALPDNERVAATLFYIDGYSTGEVGEFLDVPVGTVKRRLHSARTQLRERMVELVRDTLRQHSPDEGFSDRVKHVLEGVERIHWTTTSCLCFVGSAVACMHHLGEEARGDYVMGVSGGAFKLFWEPPWAWGNCDLLLIGEEPVKRTFAALGYDYTMLPDYDRASPGDTKERYHKEIVRSIDEGRPVIALGVVGPPEACVIAGYDKGGEVLYGRSYFQEGGKGYFSTDEWFENCHGLILLGQKRMKPSPRQVLREALAWAVPLARQREFDRYPLDGAPPKRGGVISGFAAYDAMTEALLRDEDFAFPPEDTDSAELRCCAIGNDGLHLLYYKRQDAALFLRAMAGDEAAVSEDLRAAADVYSEEMEVLAPSLNLVPNSFRPQQQRLKLCEPERRRKLAAIVREARAQEERAIGHLEQALAKLGAEDA
jgi:RNA polymerase sigma factor (sigma-70 family)